MSCDDVHVGDTRDLHLDGCSAGFEQRVISLLQNGIFSRLDK